jgi:hypothetical protein
VVGKNRSDEERKTRREGRERRGGDNILEDRVHE